ncbi:ATPase Cu transporting protein 7B [Entomophthora muscae]|uniref:ATPase Cu transporting protein 7B n=1 Tax=Entomophthora muscae TaxID=34485 RepID=A0ACC2TJY3_9FUNG|nr:ATPase Cu transporting protein 7B [Entomophthora muscae]
MNSQSSTLSRDEKIGLSSQSIITHMVRSTYNITGHVCPSCSQAIRTILSQHPMIQTDSISVEILGRVELIHDVKLTPEAIPGIVKSLGYGLSLIESNKIILRPKSLSSSGVPSNISGLTVSGFLPSCINLVGTCRSLGKALINESNYSQLQDPVVDQSMSIDLVVSGLTCGFSASTIETQLMCTEGVISASVALATSRARIEYDPAQIGARDIIEVIKRFWKRC